MPDFKPSADFVARTMKDIRSYEKELMQRERLDAFLSSKPMIFVLSASGVLLGIINFARIVSTLIFPTPCH